MTILDPTVIDPEAIFRDRFGDSVNFMSPELVGYQVVGHYVVELSKGSTIMGAGEIFGVTVLEVDGTRTDLSKSFHDHGSALRYVAGLAS